MYRRTPGMSLRLNASRPFTNRSTFSCDIAHAVSREDSRFLFDHRPVVKAGPAPSVLRVGSSAAPTCLVRCAHFSFGARVGADRSWELPRRLNSMQDRQAARKRLELAGAGW